MPPDPPIRAITAAEYRSARMSLSSSEQTVEDCFGPPRTSSMYFKLGR